MVAIFQEAITRESEMMLAMRTARLFVGCLPLAIGLFLLPARSEAETVFSAGNHREAVHVAYRDFVRLAQPTFGEFSTRPAAGPRPAE